MSTLACPQAKRRLQVGCSGSDVMAVQRAVYVGLRQRDGRATNGRSGAYGSKTAADIKAFQKLCGLNVSGEVGLSTLVALWDRTKRYDAGAFDAHGVELLFRAKVGRATKLDGNELRKGERGPHVAALQRMLWRALGADSKNSRNGTWGEGTTTDVRRFHGRTNWPKKPDTRIDQEDWRALWGFGDDRAKKLARKQVITPDDAIRQKVRSWGEWYVQNRSRITYAQVRPYPKTAALPIRTDCSGSSTHILLMAGCPNDPHGRGWDGQGYTGTMYQRGNRISLGDPLKPGDCVFYGNQGGGVPSHVVIVIGPGDRAMTFGSNPPTFVNISSYWRTNLRSDVGARRYF